MNDEETKKWSEIFKKQKASGMSVEQFCKTNSIGISTFYTHRKKLISDDPVTFRKVEASSRKVIEFEMDGHRIRCRASDLKPLMEALL